MSDDKTTIDGHMFEINYDGPANVTARFEALFDRDELYEKGPIELFALGSPYIRTESVGLGH